MVSKPDSSLAESAIPCPSELATPIAAIVEALEGLKFGQLTVVVHDGVVVQIDRTERRRLDRKPRGAAVPES